MVTINATNKDIDGHLFETRASDDRACETPSWYDYRGLIYWFTYSYWLVYRKWDFQKALGAVEKLKRKLRRLTLVS